MEKFYVKKQDKKRWSEQLSEIYLVLSDREWHSREEIVARTGALEPSSRISELRKKGYKIQCNRGNEGGATLYKIMEYVGYDTTSQRHCVCCRYNSEYKEPYTG